ncbi:hypothetical protein [Sinorhizobium sojae]|uniref:hypothetical protein n=1 Tax=Sinorhizobium sojae TaxID=716925 RepID=UPI0006836B28|nr:hypothetical protein [Sinorhizobium sojae]
MRIVWAILTGAFLVLCGLLYMTTEALSRRRLSKEPDPVVEPRQSLEPRRQGLRFLGMGRNWPGAVLMFVGALLLLYGAFLPDLV